MIETAMRAGSHLFEWTHKRPDGVEFPADVLLSQVAHGEETLIYASVRDITDRKRAEDATEHELSPDGIPVVDSAATIISFNRRFGEIMNVPPEPERC